MSSIVRPEYGPTLAEVAGPRWPRLRLALIAFAVLVALFSGYRLLVAPGAGQKGIVVATPVAFNLLHDHGLRRLAPVAPQELRLNTPPGAALHQGLSVTPWTLPPYTGTDPGGAIPLYAGGVITQMSHTFRGFVLRSEGRARINLNPGYVIAYQFQRGGETWYGRRYLLYPDVPSPRRGVTVDLQASRSVAVPNPDAVGHSGPLKLPLRSFRFGTERP